MANPKVALVMGSDSDFEKLKSCITKLKEFKIDVDVNVISAHRTPDKAAEFARNVVYEINTNELLSYTVTLNGEELQAGTDYTVTTEGGNGSWMRYIYTINKELFEAEGEYVIVVSSTDSAENNAFSDIKNANISFVVDRTAPIVTVSGLADNASYNVEKQMVSIIPTDDGGLVNMLMVRRLDRDGNVIEELFNMSGDELREFLDENGGIITVEINEGLNQNIQIICEDKSYDETGKANIFEHIYEDISISPSAIAIFFAGDGMLYVGGVAGITAIGGTSIGFFRKRGILKVNKKK